jgi:predicted DNA-binding protein with PD1-like motif
MNVMHGTGPVDVVVVGIAPGEMLLESITEACREKKITNGAVVSGVGTLSTLRMHYVTHADFPPTDEFVTLGKPLELVNVSGVVADGEPHLHVTVSCKDEKTWAGHLEPGSRVLYLAEIVILKFTGLELARRLDEEKRVRLLGGK